MLREITAYIDNSKGKKNDNIDSNLDKAVIKYEGLVNSKDDKQAFIVFKYYDTILKLSKFPKNIKIIKRDSYKIIEKNKVNCYLVKNFRLSMNYCNFYLYFSIIEYDFYNNNKIRSSLLVKVNKCNEIDLKYNECLVQFVSSQYFKNAINRCYDKYEFICDKIEFELFFKSIVLFNWSI